MGRMPARRKGSKLAEAMPEETKRAENEFYRCPGGHGLPNRTAQGECTPLYCAGSATKTADSGPVSLARAAPKRKSDPEDIVEVEKERVARSIARESAWREALGTPTGLKGSDAERFVEEKLVELSPLAVMEVEKQLRWGDDGARYKAAQDVLNATGHGKKEQTTSQPTIVIQGGNFMLPWAKPKELQGQTIVSTALPAKTDAKE